MRWSRAQTGFHEPGARAGKTREGGRQSKKGPRPPEEDRGLIARRHQRQQRSYLAGASAFPSGRGCDAAKSLIRNNSDRQVCGDRQLRRAERNARKAPAVTKGARHMASGHGRVFEPNGLRGPVRVRDPGGGMPPCRISPRRKGENLRPRGRSAWINVRGNGQRGTAHRKPLRLPRGLSGL